MATIISDFRMPRYNEIPNVGLYLEQTIKYINECLAPLKISVTSSMISNYVKHGYIDRPVKKQYYKDQIAYIIFAVLAKQVLAMDNIKELFKLQQRTYSTAVAYNYFCDEFESVLKFIFEETKEMTVISSDMPFSKKTLRSVVIAIAHIIYLDYCFEKMENATE